MTVRIRQLVRVSSGRVPPTPPVVVTMQFVQQPTDTAVNELFTPSVSVEISDGGNDVLRISSECAITPITVTAQNGLAVFTGLRTGNQPATDCHLRVENLSRPSVAAIVSVPFDITSVAPPVAEWNLVASGTSTNDPANFRAAVNGLNTTDAQLIVLDLATFMTPENVVTVSDNKGNVYQPLTLFSVVPPVRYWQMRFYVAINPIVGSGHNIDVFAPTFSGFPSYPEFTVMAFHNTGMAINLEITGPQFGNVGAINVATSISPASPAVINFDGGLAISGLVGFEGGGEPYTSPPGYTTINAVFMAAGYRSTVNPSVEQPVWTTAAPTFALITNLIVFSSQ